MAYTAGVLDSEDGVGEVVIELEEYADELLDVAESTAELSSTVVDKDKGLEMYGM